MPGSQAMTSLGLAFRRFFLACVLTLSSGMFLLQPMPAAAAVLWVAGRPLESSVPVRSEQGYLLVPAAATFGPLGIQVGTPTPGELHLQNADRKLVLRLGSRTAYLDGQPRPLPVTPQLAGDEWLVPLSAVAIALNLNLYWDNQLRSLQLEKPETARAPAASPPGSGPGSSSSLQVTLETAEGTPTLLFRSERPFSVQLTAPAAETLPGPAGADGPVQRWQVWVEGILPTTQVALPAILPGHWPAPWQQVRQLPPSSQDPHVTGIAFELWVQPGFTLTGPWPLRATAASGGDGRYEARLRLSRTASSSALPPVQTPARGTAPGPAGPVLTFTRRPGESAQLTLAGGDGHSLQLETQVLRDPDRLVLNLTGWEWPFPSQRLELADPDFQAIAVNPQPGDASNAPSVQVVLWQRHPGWVRVVRGTGDQADTLFLDVLRLVQQVTLAMVADASSSGAGGDVALRVDTSGPVRLRRAFRLPDPERLVLDLEGAANPVGGPRLQTQPNSWVRQVRVSQFDPRTVRVVVDLASPAAVHITQSPDGSSLMVTLGPPAGQVTTIDVGALHPPDDAGPVFLQLPSGTEATPVNGTASALARTTAPPPSSNVTQGALLPYPPAESDRTGASGSRPEAQDSVMAPAASTRTHLKGRLIVLDAGHGGRDPGAIGVNGLQEKDVALALVLQLQKVLEADGARVLLTRQDDTLVDWAQRVAPANLNHADALLSIHLNSYQGPSAHGVETYYRSDQAQARRLAQALQEALVQKLAAFDGGARARDDLYVVRQSWVPAVLIEVGYLSNPDEAAHLADPGYQARAVQAIADGLDRYFAGNLP
ncbi:MAG: N-acetylmuramoyl-L-alanine amidase [Limnochordaceae bacterium]|nr:N-acetylmuramoyl-L-alanine amidase [Limnochordaceae bacterium]